MPEIAARDHSLKIIPLLENLLNESGEKLKNINFISYTAGPGLIGSLLIGDTVAKTLSKLLDVELIPINHLEGHILAPCMEYSELKPPYICLLVSGGHTQIIVCESFGTYKVIGETIDDDEKEYAPAYKSSDPKKMDTVPFSKEDDDEDAMSYFEKLANE